MNHDGRKLRKRVNKLVLDTPWTKRCVVWHLSLGRYNGNYCICSLVIDGQGQDCARSMFNSHTH